MEYTDLPKYRCHKVVRAAKILNVHNLLDGTEVECEHGFTDHKSPVWADRHDPSVGGYLVFYEDGYCSYSPAEAFESGYMMISMSGWPTQDVQKDL